MTTIAASWDALTKRHLLASLVDINLRGAGQVMLQANPLTGLLFLVGIAWGRWPRACRPS
jgi:urea transporter